MGMHNQYVNVFQTKLTKRISSFLKGNDDQVIFFAYLPVYDAEACDPIGFMELESNASWSKLLSS